MRRAFYAASLAVLFGVTPALAAPVNLPGRQSTIVYQDTGRGATFLASPRTRTVVVYDSATGTYTLRDTVAPRDVTSTFGPSDISATDAAFTYYDKSSGLSVETFRLLNKSRTNPIIALTYVQYGHWRRASSPDGVEIVNDTYVVFGQRTPPSDMPLNGTGSYVTYLDGTYVNRNGAYAVTGSGSLTANFGSGTISYSATLKGDREGAGPDIAFGTLTGTGTMLTAGASFMGTGTVNGLGYQLSVSGNFYGPDADEIGGTFRLTGNGGEGTGAIVGD